MQCKFGKIKPTMQYRSILFTVTIGIILGLVAKLVDVPQITGTLPILDDIFGRFGVWIFIATLLSVFSNTPVYAAIRVFSFFISMLLTYYAYTILFLGFFPKSQIILWSFISIFSPICAAAMWYAKGNKGIANILAAAPIVALCTEWYITGRENILLLTFYICMIVCLLICVIKKAKRCLPVLLIAAVITLLLIRVGWMDLIYGGLLNI
ncbi:hypothetical protein [Aminipila terrae]|uniref:Uncharacterized protein n=1 Tax=Aminipila terrae TaxID=2697030 RepID=A0A6P1MG93_9FIRM|nr:hypothetical protein [Aminipila terrae]QHI72917.1 hypothetical protein Ami3637_11325 [Aminipila terrae]